MVVLLTPATPHAGGTPSPWVRRFAAQWPRGARVLDLACGSGRHVKLLTGLGLHVTAIDRDAAAVEPLRPLADVVVADLEAGPWPLPDDATFDAVVVTHYLWRALLPRIVASVAPGGWLVYETFARGNETVGRPSNPAFLLAPGELLAATQGALRVVAYEDGFLAEPPRYVQRIAAVRERPGAAAVRYPLDGGA